MKKILYTLFAGVMALVSCSKSDDVPTAPQSDATTFTFAIDGVETRATSTITPVRYVMEVWSADGMTAENVFEDGTKNHAEILASAGNSFTVTLDKTKAYTCLFWADDNVAFDAASLKAISLNAGKDVTEAYFSKVAVDKGKNPAVAVTLKRAVAKITLTETVAVSETDDLALKLSNVYPTFSVMDGTATGTAAEWTKTVKPTATTGVIGTFYFFAKSEKELSDLTFTYAGAAEKTVSNIPVQQNYATNIKGEFSIVTYFTFTVTADDEWLTPNNDVEFPKVNVGDYYYKDKTISSIYTADVNNPCIGIVFVVNADGKTGKIVGLTEPIANWNGGTNTVGKLTWGSPYIETFAKDEENGATNMATIKALNPTFADYPAFAWAESQNTPAIAGISWYIPASKEVRQLYAAMSGLKWVASGAGAGEINDWGNDAAMPNNTYAAARTAFNGKFTSANGTPMELTTSPFYWSSTENSSRSNARFATFGDGTTSVTSKGAPVASVRVVSAF